MDTHTLIDTILLGESSTVQFKRTFDSITKLTTEIAAFLNTNGGKIIIGVDDDKSVVGIEADKEDKLIQWLGDASTEKHLNPPASITIEKHLIDGKMIIVVDVPNGANKPYQTKEGSLIYVKNAADKRIASVEELRRMMQSSTQIYIDELPVQKTSLHDLEAAIVEQLLLKKLNKKIADFDIDYKKLLENISFLEHEQATLAGLLIACNFPQQYRPSFAIHCLRINGISITSNEFIDKENPFKGNIQTQFENTLAFIDRNIQKVQVANSINSQAEWVIPKQVFEEVIINALLHRDYTINATIRVLMFDDRIEIISPGKLPNSQNIEKITTSSHLDRNPVLASNARYLLPSLGIGTGIPRILELYPNIQFKDDRDKDLFIVTIIY